MTNKTNNNLISYSLHRIQTNKFSFTNPKTLPPLENTDVNYHISPVVKYNIEAEFIIIIITATGSLKDTEELILETENTFVFHAKDLKTFLILNEETKSWKFVNPKDEGLIITLLGISLSTLRGIIYEKSKGTILEIKPLPIMNPATFIKKDEQTSETKME